MDLADRPVRHRPRLGWRGVLLAAALALALDIGLSLIGGLLGSAMAAALLGMVGLVAAGFLAVRLRPATRPVEAGLGACVAVALLTALQLLILRGNLGDVTAVQIMLSALLALLAAFGLAWAGASIARRGGRRAGPEPPPPVTPMRPDLP
jgi:hypothetical protein